MFLTTTPSITLIHQQSLLESQQRQKSRYELMLTDPNFTAKTQYFAKRLEELQQLHDLYRNLAKQVDYVL